MRILFAETNQLIKMAKYYITLQIRVQYWKIYRQFKQIRMSHKAMKYANQLKYQLKKLKQSHPNNLDMQDCYRNFKKLHQIIGQLCQSESKGNKNKQRSKHKRNSQNLPQFFQSMHQTTIDMRMRLLAELGISENKRKALEQQIQQLINQLNTKNERVAQMQKEISSLKNKVYDNYSVSPYEGRKGDYSQYPITSQIVNKSFYYSNIKSSESVSKNTQTDPYKNIYTDVKVPSKQNQPSIKVGKYKQNYGITQNQHASISNPKQKQDQLEKQRQRQIQRQKQRQMGRQRQKFTKQLGDLKKQCQKLRQTNKNLADKLAKQIQVQKVFKNQLRNNRQPQTQQAYYTNNDTSGDVTNMNTKANVGGSPDRLYDNNNNSSSIKTSYDNVLRSFCQYPNERNLTELQQTFSQQQLTELKAKSLYSPNTKINKFIKYNQEDFWRFFLLQATTIQQFINSTNQ